MPKTVEDGTQKSPDTAPDTPPWLRTLAAVVVAAAGGYLAVVAAAFAAWSEYPPGWERAGDGAVSLLIAAVIGLATAAVARALSGRGMSWSWIAVGLLPAVWGLLNAADLLYVTSA